MKPNEPKNHSEFFDLMTPETRERLLESFKKFAWQYATATARGFSADGKRTAPPITEEMQALISEAALESLFGKQGAADYSKLVVESVKKLNEEVGS